MILKTLTFDSGKLNYLCTVCITDNNGGKIALTIIISALVLLGVESIDVEQAKESLHILLKYQSDIEKAAKELTVEG